MQVTLLVPPRWDESTSMVDAHIPPPGSAYQVRIDHVHKAYKGLSFRYKNIRATLQEVQPDVIFLYEEPYSYVAWQILYWKRKICPQAKFIFYTWQNLDCRYPLLHRLAEQYVFKHCDLAVAGSTDVENILRLRGFTKEIYQVPLALDPQDFPSPLSSLERTELRAKLGLKNFTLGYIGRMAKEKGLEDLFQALSHIQNMPWQLLLIGSGPDELDLRQHAQKLNIDDRIIWITYVKNTDMFQYYSVMDAFVLPSRTTPAWKEQFGRVLIESMVCGTPVIGSSSGEIPHVIADAGLVFPERDVNSLTAAISKLIDDPHLHKSLSLAGRERVFSIFTWQKIAQQTANIIREVADRRSE